jgi:hypothetical protein
MSVASTRVFCSVSSQGEPAVFAGLPWDELDLDLPTGFWLGRQRSWLLRQGHGFGRSIRSGHMDTLNRTPGIAYATESPAGNILIATRWMRRYRPGVELVKLSRADAF